MQRNEKKIAPSCNTFLCGSQWLHARQDIVIITLMASSFPTDTAENVITALHTRAWKDILCCSLCLSFSPRPVRYRRIHWDDHRSCGGGYRRLGDSDNCSNPAAKEVCPLHEARLSPRYGAQNKTWHYLIERWPWSPVSFLFFKIK